MVPAGVDQAEAPGVEKQRQLVEPFEEVMPVPRMLLELGQGFVDQPTVARVVFTHELLARLGQAVRA
ncbi:hypothetical protein D3C85_1938470 [compost metagenome]